MDVTALTAAVANLSALVATRIAQEQTNIDSAVKAALAAADVSNQDAIDATTAAVNTIAATLAPPAAPAA